MQQEIRYGIIHAHSENSLKDSTMTPTQLVERAKEYGSPAVTLTDHGTLTGIYEFMNTAKKNGIKAIPGVEAYVQEDDSITKRSHLVLLAKNYDGYKAICRAVTKSNTRIIDKVPLMNKAILAEFFGKEAPGHGNVIATSACVGGVLAKIMLANNEIEREIAKLTKKQSAYPSPHDKSYLANMENLKKYGEEVKTLTEERDALKKIADKKYGMKERALAKLSGSEYDEKRKALEAEKKESAEAAKKLEAIKSLITTTKKKETLLRQRCHDDEEGHTKWKMHQADIERLQKNLRSEEVILEDVKKEAKWYKKIFGKDFFIELQNHGIPEEGVVMPKLAKIAEELSIPVVAANDAHFLANSPSFVRARAIVNALRFNTWFPEREDDTEYYIKTDAELEEWLLKILDKETVDKAFTGIKTIVGRCDVTFPKGTHFPRFIGGVDGETSKQRLRRLVEEGILKRYPNQEFKYRDRVEYELSVIEKMNYVDYLCIVQDYLEYGRMIGKNNPEGVGLSIGPGRGSAAGSLVCYLIGITTVDPMPLGLIFERFLNPERVSSPDIDCDMSSQVRDKILDYVRQKYGDEAVCCIMTKGTLAAKAAIKAVARVRGSEMMYRKYGETSFDIKSGHSADAKEKAYKEELKRLSEHFSSLGNAIAKVIPKDPKATITKYEKELLAAFEGNDEALSIIRDAKLVEGTPINYGMHAAGVIIADNGDVGEYIPMMWNDEKGQWCSQCNMVEAEAEAGLLKFDFLGLINLDIITDTLRAIKRNTGVTIDIEKIPQEAVIYREIFQKGRTNFVFQFESQGMQSVLRKFKPENLEHLILLNAIYRPGPMQYVDAVCDVKNGKKKPTYICESAKDVLSVTYGYPIYQEQIMQLCNKVAGFSLGESDQIRRYMSKKKTEKMAEYEPKFIDGLIESGADPKDANDFWQELMHFAEYAFNKSHSAAYAVLAYYTAWLKYHYPTEYMTSVMNYTMIKKLPMMVQECKNLGVKIVAPNVEKSDVGFTGKDNVIMFGLSNVKGVAAGAELIIAERQNGAFHSYKDFLRRLKLKKNVCETLIDAGALDLWGKNRAAMKFVLENLMDDIKKIEEKQKIVDTEKDAKKRTNAERALKEYTERFNSTVIPVNMPESKSEKLAKENELLGMYVSGHPLDEYPAAQDVRSIPIIKVEENEVYYTVCGLVKNCRYSKRKKDGKEMAFFTLEDYSDSLEVCCFVDTFAKYGQLISDGNVLVIEGKSNIEREDSETDDADDEVKKQIYASKIYKVEPKKHKLIVSVKGLHHWTESVYRLLQPYSSDKGMEVIVHDLGLGEFRETTLKVLPEVVNVDFSDFVVTEADI